MRGSLLSRVESECCRREGRYGRHSSFCFFSWYSFRLRLCRSKLTAQKKMTVAGTLTRVVAIGGETSGWSLEFKNQVAMEGKKVRSIEVTGSPEELERLKGQRVRVEGMLVHHTGMERGDYLVLEISSIRTAK